MEFISHLSVSSTPCKKSNILQIILRPKFYKVTFSLCLCWEPKFSPASLILYGESLPGAWYWILHAAENSIPHPAFLLHSPQLIYPTPSHLGSQFSTTWTMAWNIERRLNLCWCVWVNCSLTVQPQKTDSPENFYPRHSISKRHSNIQTQSELVAV